MIHLHREVEANPGDEIQVILDHPANVQLLNEDNYHRYIENKEYRYHGGYATKSPMILVPPAPGKWHLVVDLGGGPGQVRASVRIVPQEMAGF